MFSGRWEGQAPRDKEGRILLDRDPDSFAVILNYLRDVSVRRGEGGRVTLDRQVDARLARELDFYGIPASRTCAPRPHVCACVCVAAVRPSWPTATACS